MKKPSPSQQLRQHRLARYRFTEHRKRKHRRYIPIGRKLIRSGDRIRAPKHFNLTRGAGAEVTQFLRAIEKTVLVDEKSTCLDFKHTEVFHVPATILFFAELDRIISLSNLPKPITILDPRMRRPREVMKQIGLYDLTQDKCDVVPERNDVVFWKATKGSNQSGEKLAILESVAEKVNKDHTHQIEIGGIWRGVSEAMANTVDHAYRKPRSGRYADPCDTKWWMFTEVRDEQFTAAVCDLGCGYRATINETLPEKFVAQLAQTLLGTNRDAAAIHTAMEYGRSGTNIEHRGKGSRDARSVLEKHGTGELVILSNTGWMRYVYKNGQEHLKENGALGANIRGTVVWWKLPLNGV
jgi:hypothetical protein